MKEMIKALIAEGWRWVYKKKDGFVFLSKEFKPVKREDGYNDFSFLPECNETVPSCLFPNITFENSPIELKTLLVDDLEEETLQSARDREEQKRIKDLLKHGFVYIINVIDGDIVCVGGDDKYFIFGAADKGIFSKHCNEVYEKVYLKDLVKKRKVKKTIWIAVDENGVVRVANEKPIRGDEGTWVDEKGYAVHDASKHTNFLPLSWEDEPKQITIEMEE